MLRVGDQSELSGEQGLLINFRNFTASSLYDGLSSQAPKEGRAVFIEASISLLLGERRVSAGAL